MTLEPWLEGYIPSNGHLALDIGANVGAYSLLLSKTFTSVHAFEPNPEALTKLLQYCELVPNIMIIGEAVGAKTGDLELKLYQHHSHASAYEDEVLDTVTRGQSIGSVMVSMLSIDEVYYHSDQPVDFMKIDTEGYECEVFKGAERTIQIWKPQILVEIHSTKNGEWCKDFLTRNEYNLEKISHPHEGVPEGHHWLSALSNSK